MTKRIPINSVGRYVAPTAVGFADASGELALVTSTAPLPVSLVNTEGLPPPSPPPPPLQGTANASTVAGPYEPKRGLPMHLQLSGSWQGSVALERSTDGGTTRQGLTVGGTPWASFSGNANEPVWEGNESGATFWLNIKITSGAVSYRLSQ